MPRRKTSIDAWSPATVLDAIAQSPIIVAAFDMESRHRYLNRTVYGWGNADIIGLPLDVGVHEEDRELWHHAHVRARDMGEHVRVVVRVRSQSGGPTARLASRVSPLRRGGVVIGTIVFARDVTHEVEEHRHDGMLVHLLGPLERQIVAALLRESPLRGGAIGIRVGERQGKQASQKLRVILGCLVDRGVLAHGPQGYSVAPAFVHTAKLISSHLRTL